MESLRGAGGILCSAVRWTRSVVPPQPRLTPQRHGCARGPSTATSPRATASQVPERLAICWRAVAAPKPTPHARQVPSRFEREPSVPRPSPRPPEVRSNVDTGDASQWP